MTTKRKHHATAFSFTTHPPIWVSRFVGPRARAWSWAGALTSPRSNRTLHYTIDITFIFTLSDPTLHHITSHYITLHPYITLYCIVLHYTTDITFIFTLPDPTLHYITLHYTTSLHYIIVGQIQSKLKVAISLVFVA